MVETVNSTKVHVVEAHAASAKERFVFMHHALRRRICLLDYAPGTRLSEGDLATEFGTSRTPVRRVLGRLEAEGLVRSVQSVGTFVTDADMSELEQIYEFRVALAELLGRLQPESPSASKLAEIRTLARRCQSARVTGNPRTFAELNMDLFHVLSHLTGNRPLRETCERYYYQTERIWIKSILASTIDIGEEFACFQREIEDVAAALDLGDLEAVTCIRKAHISMSFRRLLAATNHDCRS